MLESLNYSFRNQKKHNLSNLPYQTVEKLQKKKNHGVLRGPQLDKQRWRARLGILRVNAPLTCAEPMRSSAPKHERLQKATVDKPPAHTYSSQPPKSSFRRSWQSCYAEWLPVLKWTWGHVVAWVVETATSRKVAGQFPMGSLGCSINPSYRAVAQGWTPTLNRIISCEIEAAGVWGWQPYRLHVSIARTSGALRACPGLIWDSFTFAVLLQ